MGISIGVREVRARQRWDRCSRLGGVRDHLVLLVQDDYATPRRRELLEKARDRVEAPTGIDVLRERSGSVLSVGNKARVERGHKLLSEQQERASAEREQRHPQEPCVEQSEPGADRKVLLSRDHSFST